MAGTTSESSKVMENRIRRKADRMGYRLVKSRSRDKDALDYGLYGLIDLETSGSVFPHDVRGSPCVSTLEEVENYLKRE